ncbi:PadR family transcriptional regulator [Novosphingobium sp. PASSN1]|uniref:PadR family transcriptional regulator n=1 Tax=Novosphingobium sp. PASSN1 TaxID=2015561 RepID=UPI000BD64FE0|nr:PadR family transcriptional regulator [Novosphingobium sp. PASSN1]OYU36110.1 MAG: PadR family transcriptional regulator [Novosphingobium sp. PASSN1]
MRFDRHGHDHGHKHSLGRHLALKMMARGFGGGWGSRGGGFGAGGFGGGFGDGDWDDEGPGFGRGRHGHRGGGGRGGRMFAPGELRLLFLLLLDEQDRHGYELIKAVEELAAGAYAPSPGVVYPTLALLVDEGMIAEVPGEGARKAFTITDAGRAELAPRLEEAKAVVARLGDFGKARSEAEGRSGSPPLRRAMAGLMIALRHKASGGMDEASAHQIADILDEAVRKIERLGASQ